MLEVHNTLYDDTWMFTVIRIIMIFMHVIYSHVALPEALQCWQSHQTPLHQKTAAHPHTLYKGTCAVCLRDICHSLTCRDGHDCSQLRECVCPLKWPIGA